MSESGSMAAPVIAEDGLDPESGLLEPARICGTDSVRKVSAKLLRAGSRVPGVPTYS